MTGPSRAALGAGLLLAACSGGTADGRVDVEPTAGHAEAAWWHRIARDPDAFEAVLAGGRDGWIALHRNDLHGAYDAFAPGQPLPAARAALELALLHDDLAHVVSHANRQRHGALAERGVSLGTMGDLFTAWGTRCSPDAGPHVPLEDPHASWLAGLPRGATCAGPFGRTCGDLPSLPESTPEGLAQRHALHTRALEGDPAGLQALQNAGHLPVLTEAAPGFERRHMDPCVDATLAAGWSMRARALLSGTESTADYRARLRAAGLEADLFAPWLHASELLDDDADAMRPLWGDRAGTLWAAPATVSLGGTDDVQALREQVAALTAWTDAADAAARADASPEGQALLDGLAPLAGYRQDVLVAAARAALRDGAPQQALVLLEAAHDPSEPLGAANAPALFALLAEARLKTGRTRQALDALEPLTARVPSVASAKELVGDLAVLESMDRLGDSKEN